MIEFSYVFELITIIFFAHAADPPRAQEQDCLCEFTQEDESSASDDDAEVQNAFDVFMAQNNLCESAKLCNDEGNVEAAVEEPDNTQGTKKFMI